MRLIENQHQIFTIVKKKENEVWKFRSPKLWRFEIKKSPPSGDCLSFII